MIPLTSEQKKAVKYEENLALTACPGSGKTRVIMAKLLFLADQLIETPRSIGCITYTNSAVDEIEQRLKQFGSQALSNRSEVATIHSFCLQFILRPFSWTIPDIPKQFKIITPQMSEFLHFVTITEDAFGKQISPRSVEDYSSIRLNALGKPEGTGINNGVVTIDSAYYFWDVCRKAGYLDFSMILFFSLRIIRENPFVETGIASKFKWILVDEFQDTTDVQLEILERLSKSELTNFFLVGDKNQSILEFAGAQPELGDVFSETINAKRDMSLTGNFRSSSKITELAEKTISRAPPMNAIGTNQNFGHNPQYIQTENAIEVITDHFLPLLEENNIELGKAVILAPWWPHLIPIARALRNYEIPVFGPGARPYRKSRLFAVMAEQLGACATSDHLLGISGVERGLFRLISETTGSTRFDIFTYEGRMLALTLIYKAREIASENMGGADWLKLMAKAATEILIQNEWIRSGDSELLIKSADEMIGDMTRNNIDVSNLQVSELGLFANPEKSLRLTTLHQSKGMEFEAVAMIHMNEGQLPHFLSQNEQQIAENRRLFYVGITRATKILLIASDKEHRRNRPSRFIDECGLINS